MRIPPHAISAPALVLSGLSVLLAGCSSGGSYDTMSTASLRPQEGMQRNAPRHYPDGSTNRGTYSNNSTYGRTYSEPQRRYVDPGQPTSREMASYDTTDRTYAAPSRIETASIDAEPTYNANARWQQPPSGITTGTHTAPATATAPGPVPTGYYGRPRQTAALGPQVVEVRQGDTLYALSRRHGIPVSELMAANRLPDENITIGQRIVIPTQR
ncbi:LysM peptidoglycan-binding domain-containing protein [Hyphomicrobium sp. CS1GBMeth3]|uniref:LysM peptidoglycan-binding domain-containing protein n=1 Tax=Hyphomicrobium sp. CS1GBMeth3 TaxID=1892845 RepID=UPI00093005F1|nr:LysM peptidoglycan-binding domain-containing protein [Hyphomicrobium sp. CS1GBMeth3]